MLLREVFRSDDPALRVPLSPEKRRDLEAKLNSLPREIFLADDSLGWVYQFWQKDAKEEVNRSEVKIGADRTCSGHAALHRGLYGAVSCWRTHLVHGGRHGEGRQICLAIHGPICD